MEQQHRHAGARVLRRRAGDDQQLGRRLPARFSGAAQSLAAPFAGGHVPRATVSSDDMDPNRNLPDYTSSAVTTVLHPSAPVPVMPTKYFYISHIKY